MTIICPCDGIETRAQPLKRYRHQGSGVFTTGKIGTAFGSQGRRLFLRIGKGHSTERRRRRDDYRHGLDGI